MWVGVCAYVCVCPSAVLPVCPARGRICMNQSQKLIDELFFVLLAAAAPPIPSSDDEHGTWRYTHSYFKRSLVRATGARSVCVAGSPHLSRVAVTGLPRMEVGNFF